MSSPKPSSPRIHRLRQAAGSSETANQAIIATADDAVLAKLSCVKRGYYEDPFIHAMARGASSVSDLSKSDPPLKIPLRYSRDSEHARFSSVGPLNLDKHRQSRGSSDLPWGGMGEARMRGFQPTASSIEPIIRRGTHARVAAIDQAIFAFLELPISGGGGEATQTRKVTRQVVILGAGRDTTYLRHRFGYLNKSQSPNMQQTTSPIALAKNTNTKQNEEENKLNNVDDNNQQHPDNGDGSVRWFEVDHPSVVNQKAKSWLPGCIPEGYKYECCQVVGEDVMSDASSSSPISYSISISKVDQHATHDTTTKIPGASYHLVGYDLRSSPKELFAILKHSTHGYDPSIPTLFVLECVLMYLPDEKTRDLLRYLASSATPPPKQSPVKPFVAIAVYDPIPCNDRFGQIMLQNLQKRGIAGKISHCHANGSGDIEQDDNDEDVLLSLERTQTLMDQLSKLTQTGFDMAIGCHMMDAYDHGVVSMEDRRRAARCEMLDELEEFVLLMRHYCLVVGVRSCDSGSEMASSSLSSSSSNESLGFQLCSVGKNSAVGFQEGHCTVVRR